MNLIFCIDKKKGMMFFGKRQSQDEELRKHLISLTFGAKMWMSEYSGKMFEAFDGKAVDNDYPAKASSGDFCFVEDIPYSTENVDEIILCKWNRQYPGDYFFTIDLAAEGYKKVSSEDITGKSHERITIERYVKKQ